MSDRDLSQQVADECSREFARGYALGKREGYRQAATEASLRMAKAGHHELAKVALREMLR